MESHHTSVSSAKKFAVKPMSIPSLQNRNVRNSLILANDDPTV